MSAPVDIVQLPLSAQTLPEVGIAELWLMNADAMPVHADVDSNPAQGRREQQAQRRLRQQFLLRLLLGAYLDIPGKDVELVRVADGKPVLVPKLAATGLRFSLSHSGPWMMVGIARNHVIGVDIETQRPMPRAEALARRFFHPEEAAALDGLAEPRRSERFLDAWTAKEALVKAAGTGMAGVLDQIRVRPGAVEPVLEVVPEDWPDPPHWTLLRPDLGDDLHAHVALLHPSADWRLTRLEPPAS